MTSLNEYRAIVYDNFLKCLKEYVLELVTFKREKDIWKINYRESSGTSVVKSLRNSANSQEIEDYLLVFLGFPSVTVEDGLKVLESSSFIPRVYSNFQS